MNTRSFVIMLTFCLAACSLHAQKLVKSFSAISNIIPYNGSLLFAASDGAHGTELWRSDGTPAGTMLVKDIFPGSNGSSPAYLTVYKGKVYFAANDGVNGDELWVSDGTPAGTMMFANINTYTGAGYNGSNPVSLTVANNKLFFVATNSSSVPTSTLFATDGTAAGIVQLIPNLNSIPAQLTAVGNTLYFTEGNYEGILLKSDGTPAGTQTVKVDYYTTVSHLQNINNKLVFTTNTSNVQNIRIYQLDPADNVPVRLHTYDAVQYGEIAFTNLKGAGKGFFYSIESTDANYNGVDYLWYSDGTPKGTVNIKSFPWTPYLSDSNMQDFVSFNDKLYFASPGTFALWSSDGTAAGTEQIPGVSLASGTNPVESAGKLFYQLYGSLYALDAAGQASLQFSSPANAAQLQDINGTLYFTASNASGPGLWNNIASPAITVTAGYQALNPGGSFASRTRVDSAVTSQVTISNNGSGALTLSGISVSGSAFYVNGQPAQVIKAGGQVSFNLVYFPAKADQQTGSLTIRSNDNTQSNFVVNLTGTVLAGAAKPGPVPAGLDKFIDFSDASALIKLSNNLLNSGQPAGTAVGDLSQKDGTMAKSYQLASGDGDSDNGSFALDGDKLKTAAVFNFKNKNTYTIRVAATLADTTLQQAFVLQVNKPADTVTLSGDCGTSLQNLAYGLSDVAINGNRIVAIGGIGKIISSTDNGANWSLVNAGITANLSKIHFADSHTGYILGGGNTMLKTEDGGISWFPLTIPVIPYPYFSAMAFPDAATGYIFGSSAGYKTTDGGKSWQLLSFDNYNTISGAFFTDKNTGYVCGSSNTLLRTTNGGLSWTTLNSSLGENTALSGITFTGSTGFVFSNAGDVLKSSDGITWKRVSALPDSYPRSGYFASPDNGYVVAGFNSTGIYKTTDGGISWTAESNGAGGDFMGIAFNKDATLGCAVGLGTGTGATYGPGRTVFVKAGASQWQNTLELTGDDYNSVSFTSETAGYLFGNGANLKTTDGGVSWHPMNLYLGQVYPYPFITSFFSSPNTGYCSSMSDLYKTSDAGATWRKLISGSNAEQIKSIYFINDLVGFTSTGDDGTIKRTADGGLSWAGTSHTAIGNFLQFEFVGPDTGFAVGTGGLIEKTTDQGLTWIAIRSNTNTFLNTIHMFDAQHGIIGGMNGLVLRTADGGSTWAPVLTAITGDIGRFCFSDKLHGYASAGSNLYETIDGGQTWQLRGDAFNGSGATLSLSGNVLYLSGTGGEIEKIGASPLPGNIGGINGETEVAVGSAIDYNTLAPPGLNYQWRLDGGGAIDAAGNRATVQWTDPGTYVLQVTGYNNCGQGNTVSLTVKVDPALAVPIISGADSLVAGIIAVPYQTLPDTSLTYSWSAKGDSTLSASANAAQVIWTKPGRGQVNVVTTQARTGLRAMASLNVLVKASVFTQPADNFKVAVTSEPCKGDNDGIITVSAVQKRNYTAILSGTPDRVFHFTDTFSATSLAAGSYQLAITADGESEYERDFTVIVSEPKDLAVYAVVNELTNTVTLNLSGGNNYTIDLNGTLNSTTVNQLTLNLVKGENNLTISTDKSCQGIIQKNIRIAGDIVIYPNPFTSVLNLQVNTKNSGTAGITLRNLQGKVVWSGREGISRGQLHISPGNLNPGIYILRLTLDNNSTEYKLWKQ